MNISAPFIKRPVMTCLVMAAILFFGIFSFLRLPVSDLPNVDYPTLEVSTSYPGASPETVASNVTSILEKQFSTIDGVNLIASTSTISSSTIVLQFTLSKSIESACVDVQAAINKAQALLPLDLPYLPTYSKVNPSSTPILYLAITSPTMPQWDLYDYGTIVIGQRLNMIEGVAQVHTYGSPYAVRVRLDPRKLVARDIGLNEVSNVIRTQNVNNPIGTLNGPASSYTLSADGQLLNAEAYNPLILRSKDGTITRLSDVGYAMDSILEDKTLLHYIEKDINQPCVVLAIQKQGGTNSLNIIEKVNALLPQLIEEAPSSLEVKRVFDRGVYIEEAVDDVEFSLLVAFVLVVAVIFFYLGEWISTTIPSCALPITIIGTFAVMSLLGFSIDILSLLGITLSIGYLIDDAIVVLENITRHVEMGKTPFQAALDGSREIGFTIVSMTMCLVAAFIPLLFMGGLLGKIFQEFAITIIVAVLISGFISLSLTPALSSRFVRAKHPTNKSWAEKLSDNINQRLLSIYKPSLEWTLRYPGIILSCGLLSLIASVFLLIVLPKDFLPPDDLGSVEVFSEAADGTSPFLMQNYQKKLTDTVAQHPSIESIVSINGVPQDSQGVMFLKLKPFKERKPLPQVIDELRQSTSQIPGLRVFFKSLPLIDLEVGTGSSQATYQYSVKALDEKALYTAAEALRFKLLSSDTITSVNSDLHLSQPQYKMKIRRDRASLLGVSAGAIENALQLAYANPQLSPINTHNSQYYVVTETVPEFYKDPGSLRQIYVRSDSDHLVPLYTLVKAQQTVGPMSVNHLNTLPAVTISFDLKPGVPLGTAVADIQRVAKETLPAGVEGKVLGTADVFKQSFANLNILLIVTIFVVYVILGILYENFVHPITVMSTLPPAALGGLLTLLILNIPLSLYAFVGLIMLLGIVMKNGIIMIDFANDKIDKENKDFRTAIIEACVVRLRPILMTTVAAMMGAVPIALGIGGLTALSRRPLGIVIIGGLIFSQILTLYFTPVIFIEIEQLREKYFSKKKDLNQI